MSRISSCFESLATEHRCALIPYITVGDPSPAETLGLMHTLVSAGADIVELGVPFSDPMADGPVIQAACERALQHNTSLSDVLDIVAEFRKENQKTPVLLMGYTNPIERMGYKVFVERAAKADIDAVLTVDMPPEEAEEFIDYLNAKDIDSIYLLSPTSTTERIEKIAAAGRGFLYYVSLKGVTGSGNLDVKAVEDKLDIIRSITSMPIGVGFGIHDAASAAQIAKSADAVIVGSAIIRIIESNQQNMSAANDEIHDLLSSMRKAIDDVRSLPTRQAG